MKLRIGQIWYDPILETLVLVLEKGIERQDIIATWSVSIGSMELPFWTGYFKQMEYIGDL